jgi:tetratricopeptide (TPR) repeat protein
LVHARIGSTIVGEREFVFRHILTRDVAYESLSRRDRARAHARVAAWIEGQTAGREREYAELLAHHYEEALRATRAGARPDPTEAERLRQRAFHYALLAANEAGSKLALEQAQRFAETALSLAEGGPERARALETLGLTCFRNYEGDRAWRCFQEAIDLLMDQPGGSEGTGSSGLARLCVVALGMVTRAPGTMRHRVSRAEGLRYLEVGLTAAGPGDSEERAGLLIAASFAPDSFREGPTDEEELQQAVRIGEEAAAMAERLGRIDLRSAALDGIASAYQSLGRYGAMEGSIRRRLELAPDLSDPYEVGDIYAMAAWWTLNTGRYRESEGLAGRGFAEAMPESPIQGLYCLDFRTAARFRLGDWDGVLADVQLAEEVLGDRRDTPPGFAPMHLVIAAFVHDATGDRGSARRYLQLVRWLEDEEERLDPVLSLWQARLLARRGDHEEARALLERPRLADDRRGRDEILEAWCEVIAEQGAWDEAPEVVERASRHAAWAGEPPLALYASRLEGRATAAGGSPERAIELLTSTAQGFGELGAVWEAAVTQLDLAGELLRTGEDLRARSLAEEASRVFDRLGSVRELGRVDDLLGRSV